MALKWNNPHELDRDFRIMQDEYDRKAVMFLASLGERVVKRARNEGSYMDRTGNLRNSIGYVVVQNGRVVIESFKAIQSGDFQLATEAGRRHALEIANALNPNKTYLVWVAGMEYARYVEAKGFDVIQGSGDWVEATADKLIAEFRRLLMSKKV